MVSAESLLSHVVSQTLTSLTFLQSQNILPSSPELDKIRNQLIAKQYNPNAVHDAATASVSETGTAFNSLTVASPAPTATASEPPVTASVTSVKSATATATPVPAPAYSPAPPPSLPARKTTGLSMNEKQLDRAKALWDYKSDAQGDLTFHKGDIVIIDEQVNPEWFTGHLERDPLNKGLFPHNYVQRLNESPMDRSSSAGPPYPIKDSNNSFVSPHGQAMMAPNPYQQGPPAMYQGPPPMGGGYYGQPGPMMHQPSPQPQQVQVQEPAKTGAFSGSKHTLAHAAVGGLGFGAGSAIAGNIVNSIFD